MHAWYKLLIDSLGLDNSRTALLSEDLTDLRFGNFLAGLCTFSTFTADAWYPCGWRKERSSRWGNCTSFTLIFEVGLGFMVPHVPCRPGSWTCLAGGVEIRYRKRM